MRINVFKTIGLMLCFAATAMMMSCNKDEGNDDSSTSNNGSYEEMIVGDWDCVHSYDHYYHEMGGNVWQDTTRIDGWKFFGDRWKFTSDGKWYRNAYEYGTYVISGDLFSLTHPRSDGNEYYRYKIKELTSTKLVLGEISEEVTNHDYDNIPDSTEIVRREYRYEFVKI